MKLFEQLSTMSRTYLRVGLQVLVALLVILGVNSFWTGIVLGILFAVIANEVLQRRQNNTSTKGFS